MPFCGPCMTMNRRGALRCLWRRHAGPLEEKPKHTHTHLHVAWKGKAGKAVKMKSVVGH